MCRWLAYYGDPIPLELLLFRRQHSLIDQSLHSRLGATTTNGDGFGVGWYGDRRGAGPLSQRASGLERQEPEGSGRAHLLAGLLRAHPRLDGDADPGDELPPVPARALALHAQRRGARVREGAARPDARDRSGALPVPPGVGRLRGPLLPRAHLRARGRSGSRARADGRAGRGGRQAPRSRAPADDVGRRHGRDEDRRRSLLQRGRLAVALLQHRREGAQAAAPRARGGPGSLRRGARDRLGAARRHGGRLERGAGGERSGSSSPGRTSCIAFTPRR